MVGWCDTDVKNTSWRIKSTRPFVQQFIEASIKGGIRVPHYWPFVRGIHMWPMASQNSSSVEYVMPSSNKPFTSINFDLVLLSSYDATSGQWVNKTLTKVKHITVPTNNSFMQSISPGRRCWSYCPYILSCGQIYVTHLKASSCRSNLSSPDLQMSYIDLTWIWGKRIIIPTTWIATSDNTYPQNLPVLFWDYLQIKISIT